MMLRLGVDHDELLDASERFAGYRYVRQLRWMAPLADARAESPPESVVRLRWLQCPGMPRPEPQRPVPAPGATGHFYWLDVGVDELRFAVEYDGEAFHGPEQAERDRERRAWIRDQGWTVEVVRREDVFGSKAKLEAIFERGLVAARVRAGRPII